MKIAVSLLLLSDEKMLTQFLAHAMVFDLVWILGVIMGNLHWLFALGAFVIISENGKRPVWHFLVVVGMLWAAVDLEFFMGLVFAPMLIFVSLNWLVRIFIKDTSLEKHGMKIIVFLFFLTAFINTFLFDLSGI